MFKTLSAKYYQENKGRLQKKVWIFFQVDFFLDFLGLCLKVAQVALKYTTILFCF